MMRQKNRTLLLCLLFLPFAMACVGAEEELTAKELASALGVTWASVVLPGTDDESYRVGIIIEFGDGSKPIRSPMMGGGRGGSTAKIFARSEGEELLCTILLGTDAMTFTLKSPSEHGNRMSMGGSLEYGNKHYLIKWGADELAEIRSNSELKDGECGLRLIVEKSDE